ncbi:MAG: hypothetical protein PHT13_00405 [Methanosarcina sp.]|nr:hypothetical protein [Methanosarcina sp.]
MFSRLLRDDGTYSYYVIYDDPCSKYDHKYFYQHFRNPTQTRLELGWNACNKKPEDRDEREKWMFEVEIAPHIMEKSNGIRKNY